MKRVIFVTVMLFVSLGVAMSQPNAPRRGGDQGQQRDDMYKMLCQKIIETLQLEESKQAEFESIYMSYAQMSKSLRGRGNRPARPLNISNPETQRVEEHAAPQPLTAEEVEAHILESFENSIKAIEIKKEFYVKFRRILTPQEISQMYDLERHIRDRALEEQRRRMAHGASRQPQDRK